MCCGGAALVSFVAARAVGGLGIQLEKRPLKSDSCGRAGRDAGARGGSTGSWSTAESRAIRIYTFMSRAMEYFGCTERISA